MNIAMAFFMVALSGSVCSAPGDDALPESDQASKKSRSRVKEYIPAKKFVKNQKGPKQQLIQGAYDRFPISFPTSLMPR